MKKYLIILIGLIFFLLGFAYIKLFTQQARYQQTVIASTNTVLSLNNFDKSKVRIVTGNTDKITYDLRGSAQDLVELLQKEGGDLTAIDFSGDWGSIDGTIVVPKGLLVDVTYSDEATVNIMDAGGEQIVNGRGSFLIDTTNLNSFEVSDSGEILVEGWGDLIVWDDKAWGPLSDLVQGEEPSSELPVYCGIGSQVIRNYCCETQEMDTITPVCDGTGYWVFDNVVRNCAYRCETVADDENEPELVDQDCGEGSQSVRNNCCTLLFAGQYQGCIGSWYYNNAFQNCEFVCSSDVLQDDDPADENSVPEVSYDDATSDYCATVQNLEDRDACCNDTLKNSLSSGPRPGYPDCIGTWKFDSKIGCSFVCAEQTEMMEILNEIRQQIQ